MNDETIKPIDKYQGTYRIPSARAKWHDYNGGIYFITICTALRKHYFGEIPATADETIEPQIHLSRIGECLDENIIHISEHHAYAEIPLWTVMPNHVHLLVYLDGEHIPYVRRPLADGCLDLNENVTMRDVA
jgi:putative transposase